MTLDKYILGIKMSNNNDYSEYLKGWMSTNRIETLVDGIFAISMTLLVLSIGIPTISGSASETAFQQQILTLLPKFLIYALSFWILSNFWRVNHQQFFFINRVDRSLITINIFWLLFVALMPFSTSLVGNYGHYITANVIFHMNMFLIGILYSINWYYASEKHMIDENLDNVFIQYIRRSNLILPVLSLIAIFLSFFIYSWSSWIYILSPVLINIYRKVKLQ
jgi:TMEM175 potassium channel family protein